MGILQGSVIGPLQFQANCSLFYLLVPAILYTVAVLDNVEVVENLIPIAIREQIVL